MALCSSERENSHIVPSGIHMTDDHGGGGSGVVGGSRPRAIRCPNLGHLSRAISQGKKHSHPNRTESRSRCGQQAPVTNQIGQFSREDTSNQIDNDLPCISTNVMCSTPISHYCRSVKCEFEQGKFVALALCAADVHCH